LSTHKDARIAQIINRHKHKRKHNWLARIEEQHVKIVPGRNNLKRFGYIFYRLHGRLCQQVRAPVDNCLEDAAFAADKPCIMWGPAAIKAMDATHVMAALRVGATDTRAITALLREELPLADTAAAFAQVADTFTAGMATPDMWHALPFVYEKYAGYPAATAAVGRILAAPHLTRAVIGRIACYNWLGRTCCLLQPPAVLEAVVRRFAAVRAGIGVANVLTLLTLRTEELPSSVRLHIAVLEHLMPGMHAAGGHVGAALDRSLRLGIAVGDVPLLRQLLARVLAEDLMVLHPIMATVCKALDAAEAPWGLVAAAAKRLTPCHPSLAHWAAWMEAQLGRCTLQHLPAALHALAAYAANASVVGAASMLRAVLNRDDVLGQHAWTAALFFAVVHAVCVVQAVDRDWTVAAVTRLGQDGLHLTGIKRAFSAMRLGKRFIRAHMAAWASLCYLWNTFRPVGRGALTAQAWRCYRGTVPFWAATAYMCDIRDISIWSCWLRRQLRCRHGALPSLLYTQVVGAMVNECERSDGVCTQFLQILVTEVPPQSPSYGWILCRLLQMTTLPRAVFLKMIPAVCAFVCKGGAPPMVLNALVGWCQQWECGLESQALVEHACVRLRDEGIQPGEACPLLRLLTVCTNAAAAAEAVAVDALRRWATLDAWTRTLAFALVSGDRRPDLVRTAVAEWVPCAATLYGHVAMAGHGWRLPDLAAASWEALQAAAATAAPGSAGPLLTAVVAHVAAGAAMHPATQAYFEEAAKVLLAQGDVLAVRILSEVPLRAEAWTGYTRQTLWVPAAALAMESGNWQQQAALVVRALLARTVELTAAEASHALEHLGSHFPYCAADMAALTDAVLERWPSLRRQCNRLNALAAACSVYTPCACAASAGCYHRVFGFEAAPPARCLAVECSVCYEAIGLLSAELLECGHLLHSSCMWEWTVESAKAGRPSSCPLCRSSPAVTAAVADPFPQCLPPRMLAMSSAIHTYG